MGRSQRNSRPPKMVTEATFDVEARKDWLQGFRKRKRERRLTGLAHGALKARKQKLADRAARRSMRPPPAPEPVVLDEAPATRETVVLTDSNVVEQWGAAVTVTTTVGGLDVDAEDADAAEALLRGAHAPPPKKRVDAAQVEAGTLEAARRKVAHLGAQSAKRQRRAARKRDANPHFKGGGRGAARALWTGRRRSAAASAAKERRRCRRRANKWLLRHIFRTGGFIEDQRRRRRRGGAAGGGATLKATTSPRSYATATVSAESHPRKHGLSTEPEGCAASSWGKEEELRLHQLRPLRVSLAALLQPAPQVPEPHHADGVWPSRGSHPQAPTRHTSLARPVLGSPAPSECSPARRLGPSDRVRRPVAREVEARGACPVTARNAPSALQASASPSLRQKDWSDADRILAAPDLDRPVERARRHEVASTQQRPQRPRGKRSAS